MLRPAEAAIAELLGRLEYFARTMPNDAGESSLCVKVNDLRAILDLIPMQFVDAS